MRIKKNISVLIILLLLLAGCDKHTTTALHGYVDARFIDISSSAAGKLEKLTVYRGDHVTSGTLLFALDPLPEAAELERAQYQRERAKKELENLKEGERITILTSISAQQAQAKQEQRLAELTLQRQKELYQKGAVGKADLDIAQTEYNRATEKIRELAAQLAEAKLGAREPLILAQEATVAAEEANIKQLNWLLEQKTQYAPVAARVFDTFFEVGEFIPAGRPVLSLLPADNIYLVFFVPERKLSEMHVGNKVNFRCDSCQRHYQATITYIATRAEFTPPVIYSEDSRDKLVYRIEATLSPDEALQFNPGQPVDIELHTKALSNGN